MTRPAPAAILLALLAGAATAPAETPPGGVTKIELDGILGKLGYEPRKLDDNYTESTVKWKGGTYYVRSALSLDTSRLWFDAYLLTINRPEEVPAATWRKLVFASADTFPVTFSYKPTNQRLYLVHSVPNTAVTPETVRKDVELLVDQVDRTTDLWRLANYVPAMTPEGEKDVAALAGKWRATEFVDQGKPLAPAAAAKFVLTIKENSFELAEDGKAETRAGLLVARAGPVGGERQLDRYTVGGSARGIYKVSDGVLTWCYSPDERPERFAGDAKTRTTLLVLKRDK